MYLPSQVALRTTLDSLHFNDGQANALRKALLKLASITIPYVKELLAIRREALQSFFVEKGYTLPRCRTYRPSETSSSQATIDSYVTPSQNTVDVIPPSVTYNEECYTVDHLYSLAQLYPVASLQMSPYSPIKDQHIHPQIVDVINIIQSVGCQDVVYIPWRTLQSGHEPNITAERLAVIFHNSLRVIGSDSPQVVLAVIYHHGEYIIIHSMLLATSLYRQHWFDSELPSCTNLICTCNDAGSVIQNSAEYY